MNSISTGRKIRLGQAEQVLINNGISKENAAEVLRAVGFALLDRDVYSRKLDDRQDICNAVRDALVLTSNAGLSEANALAELKYIPEKETVRPVFEDGTGSDGYYDVCVAWRSGTAVICDIIRKFVDRMW